MQKTDVLSPSDTARNGRFWRHPADWVLNLAPRAHNEGESGRFRGVKFEAIRWGGRG